MAPWEAFQYKANPDRIIPLLGGTTHDWGLPDNPPDPIPPDPTMAFQLVLDEQFVDGSKWNVYNQSSFGSPMRIQRYMAANTIFGAGASVGATGGTSMRQVIRRDNPSSTQEFSAGMVDSKNKSLWYPLYGRYEFRCKTPHGQGIWPANWLTARSGGATMAEWDMLEYFHTNNPGRNSTTFHGTDSTGAYRQNWYTNNQNRTFFEAPTYTPGWHVWASEILPVTDATGQTIGDVTKPSRYIRFRMFLDGNVVYSFVHTDALRWSTNGSTDIDHFWNIYIQGAQVDGDYIGHPDDELGYSHNRGVCLLGGSPGSCVITKNGYSVIRAGAAGAKATMGGPAVTLEHDYYKIWKAVMV